MWRFGWVLLDYDMMVDAWVGRDGGGNRWSIPPEKFQDRALTWMLLECDGKSYRCCKPDDLTLHGAQMVPMRNSGDTRN